MNSNNNPHSFIFEQNLKFIYQMRSFKFLPRQPHHSPTQFLKTSKLGFHISSPQKFVPFAQERDSLGRLIKRKESEQLQQIQIKRKNTSSKEILQTAISHQITPQALPVSELRIIHVEQNINQSFQFHNPRQMRAFQGNKVSIRKNSLQLSLRKRSEDLVMLPDIRTIQDILCDSNKNHLESLKTTITEPQSPLLKKNSTQAIMRPERKYSLFINEIKQEENKQCQKLKKSQSLGINLKIRKGSLIPLEKINQKINQQPVILSQSYLNKKIANKQIAELNRYNTYKTLSIKLANKISQGHNQFMSKIRQTKKLAYQIKLNLEST